MKDEIMKGEENRKNSHQYYSILKNYKVLSPKYPGYKAAAKLLINNALKDLRETENHMKSLTAIKSELRKSIHRLLKEIFDN